MKLTSIILLPAILYSTSAVDTDLIKTSFCAQITCDVKSGKVCGIRKEGEKHEYKLFDNECALLKYGCGVKDKKDAYGIINMKHCEEAPRDTTEHSGNSDTNKKDNNETCANIKCSLKSDNKAICGIKQHHTGFRVRLFLNKCDLRKFNCENNEYFWETDRYICNDTNQAGPERSETTLMSKANDEDNRIYSEQPGSNYSKQPGANYSEQPGSNYSEQPGSNYSEQSGSNYSEQPGSNTLFENNSTTENMVVIVHGPIGKNPYQTIEDFFASTHVLPFAVSNASDQLNETTRRMLVKKFRAYSYAVLERPPGKGKNVSVYTADKWHLPTIASCMHKCPMKCPEVYDPVCASFDREQLPLRTYRNHCYMDAAVCRLYSEIRGPPKMYKNIAFTFCLGDQYTGLARIMPVLRQMKAMKRISKAKRKLRFQIRHFGHFSALEKKHQLLFG